MTIKRNLQRPHLSRGSALIAIFWIMGILAMAVFATLAVVKVQSDISTSSSHGHRARALAGKGLALAMHREVDNGDPLLNFKNPEFEEGYQASLEPLAQNFGINGLINEVIEQQTTNNRALSSTLLYQLFTEAWGMDEGEAQTFLHSLVEWVDPNDQVTTLSGWERLNYEREGFEGRPFNRHFKSLDEIPYVHGYEALEAANPDWRSSFNVWTPGAIDVGSASPEIISLASLSTLGRAIDVESAAIMQEQILGSDGIRGTEDDGLDLNLENLLSEASVSDVSQILDRYILEGEAPQYSKITSVGWSGTTKLTINLSLQTLSSRPIVLELHETLENTTYE